MTVSGTQAIFSYADLAESTNKHSARRELKWELEKITNFLNGEKFRELKNKLWYKKFKLQEEKEIAYARIAHSITAAFNRFWNGGSKEWEVSQ